MKAYVQFTDTYINWPITNGGYYVHDCERYFKYLHTCQGNDVRNNFILSSYYSRFGYPFVRLCAVSGGAYVHTKHVTWA